MGKNAPFGRPGASDRLRLWWQGTSTTTRWNALVFLVVGTISAGLVWAGVSRDATRTQGLATASRPSVSVAPTLATIPASLDLKAAGTEAPPSPLGDPGATTTTTSATLPASTTVPVSAAPTAATVPTVPPLTPSSTSPPTTVVNNDVVFTTVPAPEPAPDPTIPPLPSSTVPTTTPPTSTPPPTSAPRPSSAPPTTSATLLPGLPLPPLLGR